MPKFIKVVALIAIASCVKGNKEKLEDSAKTDAALATPATDPTPARPQPTERRRLVPPTPTTATPARPQPAERRRLVTLQRQLAAAREKLEAFRSQNRPAASPTTSVTYEVTIRCHEIPPKPSCHEGRKIQVKLFHFGRHIPTNEANAEMDKSGYRSPFYWEFSSFSASHRDFVKNLWIVSLNASSGDAFGQTHVPYKIGGVIASIPLPKNFVYVWHEKWQFVAVRK